LSVCGTKDKRAVTVQRVCFKRSGKNLVGVWRTANGIRPGRRTEQQAVEERGERGSRIGDLEYSDKYLELGMLKGNHFAITLRYVFSLSRFPI
jgi:tRNA pseudouridine13 synthase